MFTDMGKMYLRSLWLKALESGEYKKGKGSLKSNNQYCCLGVACEVLIKAGLKMEVNGACYDNEHSTAPRSVVRALGLRSTEGENATRQKCLTRINDSNNSFEPVIKAIKTGEYWN